MERARLLLIGVLVAMACLTSGQPGVAQEPGAGDDFFSNPSVFSATLEAPFQELFARGRRAPDFSVAGTLSFKADDGREVTMSGVEVTLRGNTSLQQSECEFPKLRLKLPAARPPLFRDVAALKLGTHCADRPDGALTPKYGRWPNEKSPHREAAVYRLLAAVNVPTPKARAARLTYATNGGRTPPLTRNALLLEDDERLLARLGVTEEIDTKVFTSAREVFSAADAARISFAEAMIGNFDWCLRFYPGDRYRCNDQHPLWNVLALKTREGTIPAIHDFDLAGLVTGRHLWFEKTFNIAFSTTRSGPEVEVIAQLQRTRRLFTREQLDATRREFVRRKPEAYAAIAASPLDEGWQPSMHAYLDSFFGAIEQDERFYLRAVVTPDARLFLDAAGTKPACGPDAAPIGTAVSEPLEAKDGRVRVNVLDTQWFWTTPRECDVIRRQPVWIAANAVSRDYPK